MRKTLDAKDLIILKMIARTTARNLASPSIMEMMAKTGITSKSVMRYRLHQLIEKRYITSGGFFTCRTYRIHPDRIAQGRKHGRATVRHYYQVF